MSDAPPFARPRPLRLDVAVDRLALSAPFHISGYVFHDVPILVVRLRDGDLVGRGEAAGVYYLADEPQRMAGQIEAAREAVESGADRRALRVLLPPGGARNALDCALWELESLRSGRPVWELAGMEKPRGLLTTFTLGADAPEVMADGARRWAQARALKLKLTGDAELDPRRVAAVRAARPDVWLGVDANQGFDRPGLERLMPALLDAGVSLLEQPFQIGREADLDGMERPIPVAADESVQALSDVAGLAGRFDVVNIKLDKCGGLTEGLMMAAEARRLGMKVMVGNMVGTSWAMAPAFVLGQLCDVVDLDGPIYLKSDHSPAISYDDGLAWCSPEVWGGG